MIRRRTVLAALMLSVPVHVHAQEESAARLAAIQQAVSAYVLPGHRAFATSAEVFAAATRALEETPDAARADAARAAWIATALAFQRIRHLRFGPMEAFDRAFRIALFPDPRNTIARELAETLRNADPSGIASEAFRQGRIPVQGLPAAERLLFGDQAAMLLAPDQGFRRSLLRAIGRNVASLAADMLRDWIEGDPPYARAIEGADHSFYRGPGEGLLALFKSLHGGLAFLADRQIARPFGASFREARPRSAEAWRSEQSLALARASLRSLMELHQAAFERLLRAADPTLAVTTASGFATADQAAARIVPDLESAVTDPHGRMAVETLLKALGDQRRLLAERVAPALGIPAGFNAMDGD